MANARHTKTRRGHLAIYGSFLRSRPQCDLGSSFLAQLELPTAQEKLSGVLLPLTLLGPLSQVSSFGEDHFVVEKLALWTYVK
jgi:hypothetical protein